MAQFISSIRFKIQQKISLIFFKLFVYFSVSMYPPSGKRTKSIYHPCSISDKLAPVRDKNNTPKLNYKHLLKEYEHRHGKKLKPVKHENKGLKVKDHIYCPHCNAIHEYIYYNNGKLRTQFQCKICNHTFADYTKPFEDFVLKCPYCGRKLTLCKHKKHHNLYRCNNKDCGYKKIKENENDNRYHFSIPHVLPNLSYPPLPDIPHLVNLKKIRFHSHTFNLVISHLLSGFPARTLSKFLSYMYKLSISYQTILNYKNAFIALIYPLIQHYMSDFEAKHIIADETYYKINGNSNYLFLAITDDDNPAILHFNPATNRDGENAMLLIADIIGKINSISFEFTTDKAPIYTAAIEMIRSLFPDVSIIHHTVKGLVNEPGDTESATYRHLKNVIERLNREIKRFVSDKYGFASSFGVFADFAMFVLGHNFLFDYGGKPPPINIPELQDRKTLPDKVAKLVELAQNFTA